MATNFPPNGGTGGTGGAVDSVNGKTGIVLLGKADIGLGNVDNTSDADKPISTATQNALDGKSGTGHTHSGATDTDPGFMSAADKSKLDGVAEGANNYTHPTGDGNLHVPATGISNNGKVLTAGPTEGSASWQDPPPATLQYLTEVRSADAPNATVPVHGVQATGAETNLDLLLAPKGAGAIVADIPDGTSVGGNKRGASAVDLQTNRSSLTQVASGANSVIAGGSSNTASGPTSTVGGGSANVSSGAQSTVSGGSSNTASAGFSFVGGGGSNTASGSSSTIPGGVYATTNSLQGVFAYGFNGNATGRNQMTFWGGRKDTTDATTVRLTADAGTASAANQLALRNSSAFRVRGTVVARNTSTNDCKEWTFDALIKRGANAAATAIVGTPSITSTFADAAASGWTIDVTADTTNGALAINVTGAAATTVRWTGVVHSIEVA